MKLFILCISILLTGLNPLQAQVHINFGVDTTHTEVKAALKFYNSYLGEFKQDNTGNMLNYWSDEERAMRSNPDQLMYAINDLPVYSSGYPRTVFYIKPSPDYVHIKTQYSGQFEDGNINILAITNHYIKIEGDKTYFLSPLTMNTESWPQDTIRNVTFIHPPYHTFDQVNANRLISQIEKLESEWNLEPIDIRFYFANTKEEIDIARGYDFAVGMGNVDKPSGISDDVDNQVFSGGLGENYFHEVVHVYLNRLFPKSPLREGLAVLYGGSMGRNLNWHLNRVDTYLKANPEADLNDLNNFWYEDPFTNPGSSIQGLLCRLIYEKEGVAGIKRLMSYQSYKEMFAKEWNVPMEKSGQFLRKMIDLAAAGDSGVLVDKKS